MNVKNEHRAAWVAALALFFLAYLPTGASAYIGPGAGFALVSSFLTFIVAFFAAFFALLTFPVRMILRRIRRKPLEGEPMVRKAIVLGLDGLDPEICEKMMDEGQLPNFSRLRERGTFRRLATSIPAMSPVAWSTFATGTDASRHGIFDFLSRDPRNYATILSSSRVASPKRVLKLWKLRLPLGKGSVKFLRKSKSFWKVLSEYGVFSAVIRVPITFPPEKLNGVMLSGMCVPDLRGTMGSFTYFTRKKAQGKIGGMVVNLPDGGDRIETELPGPASPVGGGTLSLPLSVELDHKRKGARIKISGNDLFLEERKFSPWVRLTFKAAPGVKLSGIARFYLTGLNGDLGLYVSPIHIDPEKPAMPISYPSFYSIYLAKKQGPYGTLGLAEDTWAINERVLDEEGFIEQAYLFHRERERMFLDTLAKLKKGLVVCVFDLSDRLQHIFFRYLVDDHAANRDKDTVKHRSALFEMYREMDRLVGRTLQFVDERTALFVISDHGFKPFKRGLDLNSWLRANGYMELTEREGDGEYLTNVDWKRTRAYAVGLGGIYINLKGRERDGTVSAGEFEALKAELKEKLLAIADPDSGERIVRRVFDVERDFTGPYRMQGPDLIVGLRPGWRVSWDSARGKVTERIFEENEKSWSGDHCMDPDAVPGILFTNLEIERDDPGLVDIAPSVLKLFGIEPPGYMTGRSLLG